MYILRLWFSAGTLRGVICKHPYLGQGSLYENTGDDFIVCMAINRSIYVRAWFSALEPKGLITVLHDAHMSFIIILYVGKVDKVTP